METRDTPEDLRALLRRTRVLRVLTVEDVPQALDLVRALAAGGLKAVEITLRTGAALAAIEAVARDLPEVTVGAGTLTAAHQFPEAAAAGARFTVSPGFTPGLADAARKSGLAWLPGVATPGEAMVAREAGFEILKLFPARAVGGLTLLKAIHGPLPELSFCPTGGIQASSYRDYLALPNVLCVGGSWMAPSDAVAAGDWTSITRRAGEVAA